jgi:hypothetical protein
MMMRFSRLHPRSLSKRHLTIWGGSILVVLTIIGYTIWSLQAWKQYEPTYAQWYQQIKEDVDKTVALPVATAEDRVHVHAAFLAITKQIDTRQDTICSLHPLLQWQAVIDPLNKKQTTCQNKVKQAVIFNEQLKNVVLYLQNDQALATLIATIPQSDELNDDAWSKQVAVWTTVASSIKTMKVSEDFKPIQTQAEKQSLQVAAAWQEVDDANQAKDKKRFLASQDSLAGAYDGMNEITVMSNKITAELTRLLQEAYIKAFSYKA